MKKSKLGLHDCKRKTSLNEKKDRSFAAPLVIAEAGCNHKGDIQIAKELIIVASSFAKADVIKFQKRNNIALLSDKEYNSPHPNPANSYGKTYGEHRESLEFSTEQHKQLKELCDEFQIGYSCSVWDVTSAKEMIHLNPKMLKVPSACNLNKELLTVIANDFTGEIHLSLGMTTKDEIEKIVSFFESKKRNKDLVLYSCTSGYPVPVQDICLLEIIKLKENYKHRVKSIGLSGHHLGIAVDIAALAIGVSHIERHFTLDRSWKGTDHAASLEPDGLRKLCRDVRNVSKSLSYKEEDILEIERPQRKKLKENSIYWD